MTRLIAPNILVLSILLSGLALDAARAQTTTNGEGPVRLDAPAKGSPGAGSAPKAAAVGNASRSPPGAAAGPASLGSSGQPPGARLQEIDRAIDKARSRSDELKKEAADLEVLPAT